MEILPQVVVINVLETGVSQERVVLVGLARAVGRRMGKGGAEIARQMRAIVAGDQWPTLEAAVPSGRPNMLILCDRLAKVLKDRFGAAILGDSEMLAGVGVPIVRQRRFKITEVEVHADDVVCLRHTTGHEVVACVGYDLASVSGPVLVCRNSVARVVGYVDVPAPSQRRLIPLFCIVRVQTMYDEVLPVVVLLVREMLYNTDKEA